MSRLAAVRKIATSWYVSLLVLSAIGAAIGYYVFFNITPGEPKIGVIDVPFTIISDNSAFAISAFLDYARERDSIKAVVIRLNSPGGSAAASEQLLLDTLKLRQEKPVVIAMSEVVASGAYMMSLGANHTYAKTSSIVGSVGVILTAPGPALPRAPTESVVITGPFKQGGGSRRHWVSMTDQLKQAFLQMVGTHRGEKLRISLDDLGQAKIYSGVEAVKLGLVDDVGGVREAIEKAASLAGISSYDLVDVNVEVLRLFNEQVKRIIDPLLGGDAPAVADIRTLVALSTEQPRSDDPFQAFPSVELLRRQLLPSGTGESQAEALPGFPLTVNPPNLYYIYVGPSP